MFMAGPKCDAVLYTKIPIIYQVGRAINIHLRYFFSLPGAVKSAKKFPL